MKQIHHFENCFQLYLSTISSSKCETWREEAESHTDTGHVTKIANFENSRWRVFLVW